MRREGHEMTAPEIKRTNGRAFSFYTNGRAIVKPDFARPTARSMSPDATETTEEIQDGRKLRGDRTKRAILAKAVDVASVDGLEGLSIGRLASELGVSKSGLFAHFGSKLELQLETVDAASELFTEEVWAPVAELEPGIVRLVALMESWLRYFHEAPLRGGCFFSGAHHEFDSRP